MLALEVDEGEALEDADVVDRLVGDHGALGEREENVLLLDSAARAAVDEKFDVPVLRFGGPGLRLVASRGLLAGRLGLLAGLGLRERILREQLRLLRRILRGELDLGVRHDHRLIRRRLLLTGVPLNVTVATALRPRGMLDPVLGRLPLPDRDLDVALDPGEVLALLRRDEGDRPAGPADAPGPADPVDVDLAVVGEIEVDHVRDVLDV